MSLTNRGCEEANCTALVLFADEIEGVVASCTVLVNVHVRVKLMCSCLKLDHNGVDETVAEVGSSITYIGWWW